MLVYVIRHGQSETNSLGRWTGWFDTPLTEKGIADAKKVGKYLKNISFDKVYASDLSRAYETAQNALPEYTYEKNELLREINVGTLENTLISDMASQERETVFADGYASVDGESREEFYKRVRAFMRKLEKEERQSVAVFSHAGWLCGMLNEVTGVKIPRKHIKCNNCTIAIFEYENQNWRLHSWINE